MIPTLDRPDVQTELLEFDERSTEPLRRGASLAAEAPRLGTGQKRSFREVQPVELASPVGMDGALDLGVHPYPASGFRTPVFGDPVVVVAGLGEIGLEPAAGPGRNAPLPQETGGQHRVVRADGHQAVFARSWLRQ